MNFKNYYEAVQKTFKFRVKSLYEMDDETMNDVDKVLDKYRPVKVSRPKKMMFQTMPLGFVGAKNAEIYFIDAELSVPTTSAMLAYDLRTTFGLSPDSDMIQVTSDCDIPDSETEDEITEVEEASDSESLLTQPDYPEAAKVDSAEHFGDAYNKSFLAYVKKVEAERDLNAKIDAPHPITKWEKQPDVTADLDTSNFNDHLKTDQKKEFKARTTPKSPKESK